MANVVCVLTKKKKNSKKQNPISKEEKQISKKGKSYFKRYSILKRGKWDLWHNWRFQLPAIHLVPVDRLEPPEKQHIMDDVDDGDDGDDADDADDADADADADADVR